MNKTIFLLFFLLIPLVFASPAELNGTIVGEFSNVTFNELRYAESVDTSTGGIYFVDYRYALDSSNRLTYNITTVGGNYTVNSTREDIPHVTYSSTTQKRFETNFSLNVTANVSFVCQTGLLVSEPATITLTQADGVTTNYYPGDWLCIDSNSIILDLEFLAGENNLTVSNINTVSKKTCHYSAIAGIPGLTTGLQLIPIIILAIIFFFVITNWTDQKSDINVSDLTGNSSIFWIIIMAIVAILIGIILFILIGHVLGNLC